MSSEMPRGKVVKEAKVASEPEALVCFLKELGFPVNRIGFEAGPLSQWLHAGLTQVEARIRELVTGHITLERIAEACIRLWLRLFTRSVDG
jgi:hypothetical protein